MKRNLKSFILAAALIAVTGTAFVAKDDSYKVDTEKSSITWIGRRIGSQHEGTIKIASGTINVKGRNITGGNIQMDMNSIAVTDLQGQQQANLTRHLKSDDFFSSEKHPQSSFTLKKITSNGQDRVTVNGDLTIKGITKPLTFPATVKTQNGVLVAVAKGVMIDRTQYDIKYRSKNFFADIGDRAIDDQFELAFNLVARK